MGCPASICAIMSSHSFMESDHPKSRPPDSVSGFGPDVTQSHAPEDSLGSARAAPLPHNGAAICGCAPGDKLGRYEVVSVLGTGGFGHVVQAIDPKLRRTVAIKFPRADRIQELGDTFLEEARSVARLDHPSIIRIYNVEESDDGVPLAVMEFVQGPTLHQLIRDAGLTWSAAVRYLIQIASALRYAHDQSLIHRDVKPANVLIAEASDTARLSDFGMALHDLTPEHSLGDRPQGTPPYMSPEQVRGENHRLDCRTDIWAFGVMMYVIFTGKKPFAGPSIEELVHQICHVDPVPPRDLNRDISVELERICLRCLEKLARSRYDTTAELLDDLIAFEQSWSVGEGTTQGGLALTGRSESGFTIQQTPPSETNETGGATNSAQTFDCGYQLVPRGLRSFDRDDADFFVDLLPGARDRQGEPESLRFWLNNLGENQGQATPVGVIYGPSGSGKSSFVKAGLLPRLGPKTKVIFLEATPVGMEQRLAKLLSEHVGLSDDADIGLPALFQQIRRRRLLSGTRILIVIDQFEQWLNGRPDLGREPLVEALRQCDGENLACLILVRDDFWMAVSQFMSMLEWQIQEGANALAMPLFDRRHARHVLVAYGRALGAIPDGPLDESQRMFVRRAVDLMADSGNLIPIHLAMFAQMMDPEKWQMAELKRMGGWQGIGLAFLDDLFSDRRLIDHEAACRQVLAALLPASDTAIKGAQKTLAQLHEHCQGEISQPRLAQIIDLMDREFRIITPTETVSGLPAWQLAHDSLVTPLRIWLAQRESSTWQGRARSRLRSLAGQWSDSRESRFLPAWYEYLPIRLASRRHALSDAESRFLKSAGRRFLAQTGTVIAVMLVIALTINGIWRQSGRAVTASMFHQLIDASPGEFPARLDMLNGQNPNWLKQLAMVEIDDDWTTTNNVRRLIAQARFGDQQDVSARGLVQAIAVCPENESSNVISTLQWIRDADDDSDLASLVEASFDPNDPGRPENLRYAVAALHLNQPRLASQLTQIGSDPEFRERFIETFPRFHGPLDDLPGILDASLPDHLVSALCKSLGLMPSAEFSEHVRGELAQKLEVLVRRHPSADVHASATYAMNRLGMPIPTLHPSDSQVNWQIRRTPRGNLIEFVRVPGGRFMIGAGVDEATRETRRIRQEWVELPNDIYVASREVSIAAFGEFVETLDEDDPTRYWFASSVYAEHHDENFPMCQLTWNEAVRFCNWLSSQHGLEPVYKWDEELTTWTSNRSANGYRLPTCNEFERAIRGLTETRYFFGGDSSTYRLARYVNGGNPEFPVAGIRADYRGRRMPNDWGLFDIAGNANEWCDEFYEDGIVELMEQWKNRRALRGGQATASIRSFSSSSFFNDINSVRVYRSGIRLVRNASE